MAESFAKRWSPEVIPVLCGSSICQYYSITSSNSRSFQRKSIKLIQYCKTTCCYQATSTSTSTTLEAPTTCTPSSSQDWFRINLKVAQKKGLTFCQTRSNAIFLHSTLIAACFEKIVAMSSGQVQFQHMYESPRSARKVVLKPAWNEGGTDTTSIEERVSNVHSSKYGETCRGEIDCRNQGLPHSTVDYEDQSRKEVVIKLIAQFETHPNRKALEADLRPNQV